MTSAAANPSIAFDKTGHGEPALLMLPGWCGPRTMFDGLRARTARHRTTLAIDWRGHGETSSGADDFGTAELVADAADVIERAGITRVV
ncbi:alpha/beta fold hydrolase, partial [Nocardia niigatensis]